MLLVLDDLHWADRSTAALLAHVLCSRRKARLLVVGAYRESELVPAGPLADALAGLRREQPIERLRLSGLDETQVVELARGWGSNAELAASIHAEAEDNPFFVKEMLRHVAESGTRRLGLPDSVKEVIGQRLDRLSIECVQVLTLSSVIGQDFDVPTLERISKLDGDSVVKTLEEGVRAGILAEVPHAFERFSFSHALIRQTLAARLTRTRRGRIHARAGEALEELHAQRLDPVLAQIAHHYCAAGRAGEADKAVEFAVRAGEQASSPMQRRSTSTPVRSPSFPTTTAAAGRSCCVGLWRLWRCPTPSSMRAGVSRGASDASARLGDHEMITSSGVMSSTIS